MIEVNFLANKNRSKQKEKRQDKRLFKISTIVLSIVIFILIAILGVKLYLNLKIKQKAEVIARLKQSILAQEAVELKYLIFVNKLESVGEIYSMRSDKQAAMKYFAELFADIADITGMNYNEENGGLTLQLDHSNIFMLDQSLDLLNSNLVTDTYKNVEKNSLSRGGHGNYNLNLQIQLKTNQDLNE